MHDPMVVAFEIRRPWPKRLTTYPSGGRSRRYWPAVITVWHVEPNGHDSGAVCKQFDRYQDDSGEWHLRPRHAWMLHVHHWRVQVHPWQRFQRWAFQRCGYCGELHRKGAPVNVGMSWHPEKPKHWWSSRPDLYHAACTEPQRQINLREMEIARAKQALRVAAKQAENEVLVEGSYFQRDDLPTILGNYMRAVDGHAREAKETSLALAQARGERDALRAQADSILHALNHDAPAHDVYAKVAAMVSGIQVEVTD